MLGSLHKSTKTAFAVSNLTFYRESSFMISFRNSKVKSMLRLLALAIGITLFTAPASVMAIALTWDNGGGDMLWSNSSNWNPDNPPSGTPASGNDITFDNTVGSGTVGATTN